MNTIFNLDLTNLSTIDIIFLVHFFFTIGFNAFFVFHRTILMLIGLKPYKKFPISDLKNNKYAILIAARNEEKVLPHLIDSINKQDYPLENITIFVVADNCFDNTKKVAKKVGAIVYERSDKTKISKGYALKYLTDCIERDYGLKTFDAFFIFDADNLLAKDFISRMHDAFMTGEKILAGFINIKNATNFISMGYTYHQYKKIRTLHNPRTLIGSGTTLTGTGIMFASEIIKEKGWEWLLITEDIEFSVDSLLRGYNATFVGEAEFYDEQPTTYKVMLRQRLRWAKGFLLVFKRRSWKLFKGFFRKKTTENKSNKQSKCQYRYSLYDIFTYIFPINLVVFIVTVAYSITVAVFQYQGGLPSLEAFLDGLIAAGKSIAMWYLSTLLLLLPVLILEWKRIPAKISKKIIHFFTFPFFEVFSLPLTIVALFTKAEWKPIEHNVAKDIESIEEFYQKEKVRREKRRIRRAKRHKKTN